MTDEDRAHELAARLREPGMFEPRILAVLQSVAAETERRTLERAAKWHDERVIAFQERYDADCRPDELRVVLLWKRDTHEDSAIGIRALIDAPPTSIQRSANCNISEKLSDVCSCGAEPQAAPDPLVVALERLFNDLPSGWVFVNLFHDVRVGVFHCRIRNGVPYTDPEVTGSGPNIAAAFHAALALAEGGR